jgi:16S rRNA (guanine966-N2)-methyltransferase
MARTVRSGGRGQLRIIGGEWRGRKLRFTPEHGLRPTADRIRETLFNWLAADIAGARCADLFAGSGALGLEALSRGAAHCDFVDTSARVGAAIAGHLETLGAGARGECHVEPATRFLRRAEGNWDVVFIDPPFERGLAGPVCAALGEGSLAPGALVYLELGAGEALPPLPADWALHREKRAGGVAFRLYRAGAL